MATCSWLSVDADGAPAAAAASTSRALALCVADQVARSEAFEAGRDVKKPDRT